jgi:hypothetical protein
MVQQTRHVEARLSRHDTLRYFCLFAESSKEPTKQERQFPLNPAKYTSHAVSNGLASVPTLMRRTFPMLVVCSPRKQPEVWEFDQLILLAPCRHLRSASSQVASG